MKSKIIFLNILALILCSTSYASYKQKITMCLDANNDTDFTFSGHFGSTDHFDNGHSTKAQPQGRNCTSHTYSAGPKNISFKLEVNDKSTLLTAGASCGFMYNKSNAAQLLSDPQRLIGKNENWVFSLIPDSPMGEYKHVYILDCLHSST